MNTQTITFGKMLCFFGFHSWEVWVSMYPRKYKKFGLFLTGCGILLYILLDIIVDISNFIILIFL